MSTDMLLGRVESLGRFVRVVTDHVGDRAALWVDEGALPAARDLVGRASTRLRLSGEHTVVAFAGATGSGKSSLFNAVARLELSPAGHLRPTTGEVHSCVWGAAGAEALLDWLGVPAGLRFGRESQLDADDEASLRGLVLLDLPDMDSIATGHRVEADRLVGTVDLVIWVLDPQKYADQTVHDGYLSHMGALRDVTVVVFNQIDRLPPADAASCRADLARLVAADGLPGVPVIATSALTGVGVNEVRTLLETTVAERRAALARLEGEVDAAVKALAPLVGEADPEPEGVTRAEVQQLADGFAEAAGIGAVASSAGQVYRQRAALPGWPFRRRADPVEVPPGEPAAVGLAVRRLAAQTTVGLPPPWPEEVRLAASTDLDEIPGELGRAVRTARPRPPRTAGWWLARIVWWLAILAALAGAAWLAWDEWGGTQLGPLELGGLEPAEFGGIAVPWLMIAGGLAVAALVLLLGRPLAAVRARRYRAVTERRLREATTTVAREVVAPVRSVLRNYADARSALRDAASH